MLAQPAEGPGWADAEELLDGFESAWNRGKAPNLDATLAQAASLLDSPLQRRRFLEELVKIDLSQRWRRRQGRPRLEEYQKRHAELGAAEEIPVELIAEEYWARQRWGDKPGHEEYAGRFPRQAPALRPTLRRIDAELAEEFARGNTQLAPPPAPVAAPKPPTPTVVRPPATAASFLGLVKTSNLLDGARIDAAGRELIAKFPDPRALSRELLRRNWLTPFQANQLLLGRGDDLFLGPYVLLERLGEGGVGQVFKARHQKSGRLVALKVIRKELVSDPEVVGRFYREVQILGELNHPNMVQRVDAGVIGGHQVLAMEYVEGVDLARLVKATGPLPVDQACDYIRQAALALEHAHEKGLVHRDIKPSNLLVTPRSAQGPKPATSSSHLGRWTLEIGLIKILDMGLARLRRPLADGTQGEIITRVGSVMMGTPDFLAPEQAADFHAADIRSDIYSLGCTFYFLLTGQPPFGGSLAQKLLMHREADPIDLAAFRDDVPRGLPKVLTKMMAKRPEQRYQTPAEVAAALTAVQRQRPPGKFATRLRRGWTWSRGRRRLLLGGVAAMLFLGCLGILGLAFRGGPDSQRERDAVLLASKPAGAAAAALDRLRGQVRAGVDPAKIRQGILKLRIDFPGAPEEQQAVELLAQLPSPFEQIQTDPAPSPDLAAVLGRQGRPMLCVAVSPDLKVVAAGNEDGTVTFWDAATGKENATAPGHRGPVLAVAFAPDGQTLASTGLDGMVRLWHAGAAREMGALKGNSNHWLAFSPDGQALAAGGTHADVRIWDLLKKQERIVLGGPTTPVASVGYAPDGKTLAGACNDGTFHIWDVATGRERHSVKLTTGPAVVAWQPDGRSVALGCPDGVIRLWDVAADKEGTSLKGAGAYPIASLAFAPDGKTLASVDRAGEIALWDVATGRKSGHWAKAPRATRLAFALDGRHLAVAHQNGTVSILRVGVKR